MARIISSSEPLHAVEINILVFKGKKLSLQEVKTGLPWQRGENAGAQVHTRFSGGPAATPWSPATVSPLQLHGALGTACKHLPGTCHPCSRLSSHSPQMIMPPNYRHIGAIRPLVLLSLPQGTHLPASLFMVASPACYNVTFWETEKRRNYIRQQTCSFQGENETILLGGMLKQSHIQFVTNTIVCSLVQNNYSIYKFSKALVPPKNTNESSFETDNKIPYIV